MGSIVLRETSCTQNIAQCRTNNFVHQDIDELARQLAFAVDEPGAPGTRTAHGSIVSTTASAPQRSVLKNSRILLTNSTGSSYGAKCPPDGMTFQTFRL